MTTRLSEFTEPPAIGGIGIPLSWNYIADVRSIVLEAAFVSREFWEKDGKPDSERISRSVGIRSARQIREEGSIFPVNHCVDQTLLFAHAALTLLATSQYKSNIVLREQYAPNRDPKNMGRTCLHAGLELQTMSGQSYFIETKRFNIIHYGVGGLPHDDRVIQEWAIPLDHYSDRESLPKLLGMRREDLEPGRGEMASYVVPRLINGATSKQTFHGYSHSERVGELLSSCAKPSFKRILQARGAMAPFILKEVEGSRRYG